MSVGANAASLGPGLVVAEVRSLRVGNTVRAGTDDLEHIRSLVEDATSWGPLLVRRSDGVIVDGVHRYRAALARGDRSVSVEYFEGDDEEVFIESVRRNVRHGKPLTLGEKRDAASQILALRPDWSDRWIADLSALSPKTIGSLRRRLGGPGNAAQYRLGRDGRTRRLRGVAGDEEWAGGKARLGAPWHDPACGPPSGAAPADPVSTALPREVGNERGPCQRSALVDEACLSAHGGDRFCGWFEGSAIEEDHLDQFVPHLPLSRVYAVADEARRRAQLWHAFADRLERRALPRVGGLR